MVIPGVANLAICNWEGIDGGGGCEVCIYCQNHQGQ